MAAYHCVVAVTPFPLMGKGLDRGAQGNGSEPSPLPLSFPVRGRISTLSKVGFFISGVLARSQPNSKERTKDTKGESKCVRKDSSHPIGNENVYHLEHFGIVGVTSVRDFSSVGFQSRAEAPVRNLQSENQRKEHTGYATIDVGADFKPAPTVSVARLLASQPSTNLCRKCNR
jgi:hypothetical protein